MLMKYLSLFIFLLSSPIIQAQILNINKHDVTTDSSNYWTGWFDFYFQTDNRSPTPSEKASFLSLESSLDLLHVSDRNAYYFTAQINHYEATGDPVISTGFAHGRINFERKKRLSYEIYGQWLFDHSRYLELRLLAGGGLKYRISHSDLLEFDIGSGFFYEHEKWKNLTNDGTNTMNNMIKSSTYLKFNVNFSDQINLAYIVFYQVGFDEDIEAYRQRISGHLQLDFNMSTRFSFMVEGSIHYENKPIIPINKTIFGIKNGFRFSF